MEPSSSLKYVSETNHFGNRKRWLPGCWGRWVPCPAGSVGSIWALCDEEVNKAKGGWLFCLCVLFVSSMYVCVCVVLLLGGRWAVVLLEFHGLRVGLKGVGG